MVCFFDFKLSVFSSGYLINKHASKKDRWVDYPDSQSCFNLLKKEKKKILEWIKIIY